MLKKSQSPVVLKPKKVFGYLVLAMAGIYLYSMLSAFLYSRALPLYLPLGSRRDLAVKAILIRKLSWENRLTAISMQDKTVDLNLFYKSFIKNNDQVGADDYRKELKKQDFAL